MFEEGWEKVWTGTEPRLSELKELYESIGYDVSIKPTDPNEYECAKCFNESVFAIYVRSKER